MRELAESRMGKRMWWHHLGIRLTFNTAVLLLAAMLLVDIVVSALWSHAERLQTLQRLEAVLDVSALQLGRQGSGLALNDSLFALATVSGTCLQLLSGQELLSATCARQVVGPGSRGGTGLPLWGPARPLYAQRELRLADGGTVSMRAISTDPAAGRHWLAAQRYILIYIGIDLFALSVFAFFRFTRQVQRPLQSLINAMDKMPDQELLAFPEQSRRDELHELAFSLNRMLRRLDTDRAALRIATAELASKNAQLLRNQQEMIRAEKLAATGQLAAGLAHEIGNPLGVVQGYLELLRMADCGADERQSYAANALQETRRMHALIGNLLRTARGNPGKSELLDLNRLLAHFVEALRPQAMFRGIALNLRLEAKDARVSAEGDAIRQVLLNALLNAADAIRATAGEAGGVIVVSTCQVWVDEAPWLDLCIADSGCGLAPEHADKIFDFFFTTKKPGTGTGLGLSVSLALVEGMGGRMEAVNGEHGGMELHIHLPLAAMEDGGSPETGGHDEQA